MDLARFSTMPLSVLFIISCASPEPPPPPKNTVFDPLTQQLRKAQDVQKTVDQNADSTRKAIDTQERGDTAP
jgi:hypothetical protein